MISCELVPLFFVECIFSSVIVLSVAKVLPHILLSFYVYPSLALRKHEKTDWLIIIFKYLSSVKLPFITLTLILVCTLAHIWRASAGSICGNRVWVRGDAWQLKKCLPVRGDNVEMFKKNVMTYFWAMFTCTVHELCTTILWQSMPGRIHF